MSLSINPVLSRELRQRMRGGKAFLGVGVFVAMLTATVFLVVQGLHTESFDLTRQTQLGRVLFEWVILVMTLLIVFFVPGIAAGAIAGERERQTLLPMQVTLLRPGQLLAGKIAASASFLLLLIVAGLPVVTTAYALGGINLATGLGGLAVVAVVGVLTTTIIVGFTAGSRRSQSATMLGYAISLALLIAGPLLFLVASVIDRASGDDQIQAPPIPMLINPVSIVSQASSSGDRVQYAAPLTSLARRLDEEWMKNNGSWGSVFPNDTTRVVRRPSPPGWWLGLAGMGVLAGLATWRGRRALRVPAEVER